MTGQPPVRDDKTGVPSGTYSREYFLTECNGHEEFQQGRLPSRLQAALAIAGELKGKRILDVGCGRGEVVLYCLRQGAEACGVDYSADALVLAYAISVHKSQGAEFPAVVMPLLTQHYMMLQRNLLYTAVTRARKLAVLVGSPRAIGMAVRNNKVAHRHTALAERLQGAQGKR